MKEIDKALKERYSDIHPMLFHRSLERAKTSGELFDLLEGMPDLPLIWDEENKNWKHTEDLMQRSALDGKGQNDV